MKVPTAQPSSGAVKEASKVVWGADDWNCAQEPLALCRMRPCPLTGSKLPNAQASLSDTTRTLKSVRSTGTGTTVHCAPSQCTLVFRPTAQTLCAEEAWTLFKVEPVT